jgi:hypothetical protein
MVSWLVSQLVRAGIPRPEILRLSSGRLRMTGRDGVFLHVTNATCDTLSLPLIAVCAATNLAMGMRNGLQLT